MFGIEHGYYDPKDWKLAMKIDWILDTFGDHINYFAEHELNPTLGKKKKMEFFAKIASEKSPVFLRALEKQLNELGTRYIASDRVTIADAVMVGYLREFMAPNYCA